MKSHTIGQMWINGLFEKANSLRFELERRRYETEALDPQERMVYSACDSLLGYIHSIEDMKS